MRRFDPQQTWLSNLQHAPTLPSKVEALRPIPGSWSWCGLPIDSPLGIPAGPLLDARWLLYYASLGFDWLVYKTVRSVERECYDLPNLVAVETGPLSESGEIVSESEEMKQSWAVSFGMPSQEPLIWRQDVEVARRELPPKKLLIVSVVATQDEDIVDLQASFEQIANDFALCAKWAIESGADGVEANFSCPNVSTADAQLFQQPEAAGLIAERIRDAIGEKPLVLKIGHIPNKDEARRLLQCVAPFTNGLAMTNSIAARVRGLDGEWLFGGDARGICGDATRESSIKQIAMFRDLLRDENIALDLIGVGGISTEHHVQSYLDAGASSVGIATAAMLRPDIAHQIRKQLSES